MADNDYLQQINSFINNLKEKFKPNRSLTTKIAEEMHASVLNNFHTQGAAVGGWAPLKPSTLKNKRRKNFSEAILQQRGDLIRSIQRSATEDTSSVHTNKVQAAALNFGAEIYHGPRTRTLSFRTDRRGDLLKQKSNPNLVVFAKKSHKQTFSYTMTQKSYVQKIPARPFMLLSQQYYNNITDIIRKHVTQ